MKTFFISFGSVFSQSDNDARFGAVNFAASQDMTGCQPGKLKLCLFLALIKYVMSLVTPKAPLKIVAFDAFFPNARTPRVKQMTTHLDAGWWFNCVLLAEKSQIAC